MARFTLNPLKWFRRIFVGKANRHSNSPALLKKPAKPRKSGNVFMHLINIQKSLKSIDLAMRQQIDFTWMVQKITGQIALLKLEAETIGDDEMAGVAGQVEAYFETVGEGRLDFDERGLGIILEFINIYKATIGDAVTGSSTLPPDRLIDWSERYQALMADMRPSFEESLMQPQEEPKSEPWPAKEAAIPEIYDESEASEPMGAEAIEPPFTQDEAWSPAKDEFEYEPEPIAGAGASIVPNKSTDFSKDLLEEEFDSFEETEPATPWEEPEPFPEDAIPLYDPAAASGTRDVVISDDEIKSAREYMETGETRPELQVPDEKAEAPSREPTVLDRLGEKLAANREETCKSPVELREVERLKAKLSELHEKQEMLSNKMTNILGDYKKAVRSETNPQESNSIENLDLEDLEDIIFIGREKG